MHDYLWSNSGVRRVGFIHSFYRYEYVGIAWNNGCGKFDAHSLFHIYLLECVSNMDFAT